MNFVNNIAHRILLHCQKKGWANGFSVESPAYNFNYKTGCIPLRQRACGLQLIFFGTFCMDHTSKTTKASTLKLARLVLPLLWSWTIPKRGQVITPDGAAALFERGGPQQTAKRDLYICRPNISSQQLYSLYLGTTLVQKLFLKYAKFWDVPPRRPQHTACLLVHTDIMGLAPWLHKNW